MMISAALDTNILIYAHIADYKEHSLVRQWLSDFLSKCDAFYLTWQVFYEYIRIVTHPQIHHHPLTMVRAVQDLEGYFHHKRCRILQETEDHWLVIGAIFQNLPSSKGNFSYDCHYAAILKEHAVNTIVSADSDFLKFQFLEVINPVRSTLLG